MPAFPSWSMDRNLRQKLTGQRLTPTIRPFRPTHNLPQQHITGLQGATEDDAPDPTEARAYLIREPGKHGIQVQYTNKAGPNAYRGIMGRFYYSLLNYLRGSP